MYIHINHLSICLTKHLVLKGCRSYRGSGNFKGTFIPYQICVHYSKPECSANLWMCSFSYLPHFYIFLLSLLKNSIVYSKYSLLFSLKLISLSFFIRNYIIFSLHVYNFPVSGPLNVSWLLDTIVPTHCNNDVVEKGMY